MSWDGDLTGTSTAGSLARRDAIFSGMRERLHCQTDRMFAILLIAQWVFAIVLALVISPWSYEDGERSLHVHVKIAFAFGVLINAPPLALIYFRPGSAATRQAVAVTQMLWSAVLIMITGGRIETHFHVFGSLAFLAAYRDWRILPTATVVFSIDHLARGLWWPDSVYGIANPEWWRFLEHAAWVVFEDVVLVLGCLRGVRQMKDAAAREARFERVKNAVERKVKERTEELQESMERHRSLVEDTAAVPFELCASTLRIHYIAPQATRLFECSPSELDDVEFFTELVHPDDAERVREVIGAYGRGERTASGLLDFRLTTASGRELHLHTLLSSRANGRICGMTMDVTRQRQLELDLQQAQKLESVGRLAAGVAHEINTPVQFVSDSVQFVRASVCDLIDLVQKQQATIEVLALQPAPELVRDCARIAEEVDLPYLAEEMPKAIDRATDGLERVSAIVRGLRTFAHPGGQLTSVDLNSAIESTLNIARSEYRYVADLETSFGELPNITCHAGEINQAILNVVLNAAHAIGDVVKQSNGRGKLAVRTARDGEHAVISISDTGAGIPEHIRGKIFDPFFTTKQVGRGTGQGLAIARAVIVDKHRGSLTCDSKLGTGTTFHIRIPIEPLALGAT